MKKFLWIFVLCFLLSSNVYGKTYKVNDIIEDNFYINYKFQINLPKGKWILAEKYGDFYYGLSSKIFTLLKIENNKVVEGISIGEMKTAGVYEDYVNQAIHEAMFKNKYHGCYAHPKYSIIEYFKKGNTHNCFWVGHMDINEHIYNPKDPERKTVNTQFKKWLKKNRISLPKMGLYSEHSYFSRLATGKWYTIAYVIDPIIFNGPKNKYFTEETSEYHKNNIQNYPKHEELMKKWISISSQKHIDFENSIGALQRHKLDLFNLSPIKRGLDLNSSDDFVDQLKKLNNLYKQGILTKEEFTKAKKKILNQ